MKIVTIIKGIDGTVCPYCGGWNNSCTHFVATVSALHTDKGEEGKIAIFKEEAEK